MPAQGGELPPLTGEVLSALCLVWFTRVCRAAGRVGRSIC
jgi:hypothetical protein